MQYIQLVVCGLFLTVKFSCLFTAVAVLFCLRSLFTTSFCLLFEGFCQVFAPRFLTSSRGDNLPKYGVGHRTLHQNKAVWKLQICYKSNKLSEKRNKLSAQLFSSSFVCCDPYSLLLFCIQALLHLIIRQQFNVSQDLPRNIKYQ